ncbi:MAG: glycosyltransferase family 39 protein [Anaerolineales bacterium]|nr:glycosyltransferase family 39 protein [Anaerolineales bacterium]
MNTNVQPFDDFARTLTAGEMLANHDKSGVRTELFLEVHPSLVPWIVFEAGVVKIFPDNPILALRILNCIACGITGMMIFLLGKKISTRTGILASTIYALYPSSIVFSAVLSCQHFSTACDYLAFVLVLFPHDNSFRDKRFHLYTITIGVLLGISQLFRPDALPMIVAIIIYTIKTFLENEKPKVSWFPLLFKITVIIITFQIITQAAFWFILHKNIALDFNKSIDPEYKFFVGFNFNQGKFVSEDRKIFSEASHTERHQLLYTRLVEYGKHPLRLIELFYRKYYVMWAYNSSSFSWLQGKEISELRTKIEDGSISAWELNKYNRLMNYQSLFKSLDSGYYFLITFFAAIAAWNLRKQHPESDLFSLLTWVCICYIGVFFFIEVQERYKYFLMPALIIFSAYGVTVYDNFVNKIRHLVNTTHDQGAV